MRRSIVLPALLAGLASCNQAAEPPAANTAEANAAAPAKKHPTYCFFKDADTKGWSASRDSSGNVAVKGQAHMRIAGTGARWTSRRSAETRRGCG